MQGEMNDLISRKVLLGEMEKFENPMPNKSGYDFLCGIATAITEIENAPAVDAVEVPETGVGDISDGYHTFNQLYYQRMVLFAALVKANKDRAWKSYRHEDGELCFGGGWFIVGIDTPEGSYTYHYENKDFDLFDCVELPAGKHWDGHTEKDVVRLLSLPRYAEEALEKQAPKKPMHEGLAERLCPVCRAYIPFDALNDDPSEAPSYCDCCGQAFDWGDGLRWMT